MRLGIYQAKQYDAHSLAGRLYKRLFRNRTSYELLRLPDAPSPGEIKRFEDIAGSIHMSNGVHRTTSRARFASIDPWLVDVLRANFSVTAPLLVHDWAASDCLTSAEWALQVMHAFPQARMIASDFVLSLLQCQVGSDTFIFDSTGGAMQYIRPPFVIRLQPSEPMAFPVNWLLERHARQRLHKLRLNPLNTAFPMQQISLVHPDASTLARTCDRFEIRQHSVFTALSEPADAIRTMNVFNRVYFSDDTLASGARSVWNSLREGGLWVVGRTPENGAHQVSILRKTGEGFELLERHGEPSEIEELALMVRRE